MASRRRVIAAVAAATGLAGFAVPTLAGPIAPLPCVNQVTGVNDKCEQWSRAYNDPSPDGSTVSNIPGGIAVDHAGQHVFVASTNVTGAAQPRVTLARLNAATGATQWAVHPHTRLSTSASAVVLSPDEKTVVVASQEKYLPNLNAQPVYYWLTLAFSASNGRQLWSTVYNIGGEVNTPVAMQMSPRGDRVFVTGFSLYGGHQRAFIEWVTIAYNIRDGRQKWLTRFEGVAGGQNFPVGLAVAPRGDMVYVGGTSDHPQDTGVFSSDYCVIAYDAHTGKQRWRSISRPGADNAPAGIAVSGRGDKVFLAGTSVFGTATSPVSGVATVSINARTGAGQWSTHYLPGSNQSATAASIVTSGSKVFVAAGVGQKESLVPASAQPLVGNPVQPSAVGLDVIAMDQATGRRAWLSSYAPQPQYSAAPVAMVVNTKGSMLYIAGIIGPPSLLAVHPMTLAVSTSGKQAWVARYDLRDPTGIGVNLAGFPAQPLAIVADRAGRRVYENVAYNPVVPAGVSTACAAANTAGVNQKCSNGGEADLVLGYSS